MQGKLPERMSCFSSWRAWKGFNAFAPPLQSWAPPPGMSVHTWSCARHKPNGNYRVGGIAAEHGRAIAAPAGVPGLLRLSALPPQLRHCCPTTSKATRTSHHATAAMTEGALPWAPRPTPTPEPCPRDVSQSRDVGRRLPAQRPPNAAGRAAKLATAPAAHSATTAAVPIQLVSHAGPCGSRPSPLH